MVEFNFDKPPDRRVTPALKVHPMVLGEDGGNLFPAGVADMDFPVAPAIVQAMRERLEHPVFGYETVPDRLLPSLCQWLSGRHGWQVDERTILRAPNVLNALSMAVNLFSREGEGVIVQPPVALPKTTL